MSGPKDRCIGKASDHYAVRILIMYMLQLTLLPRENITTDKSKQSLLMIEGSACIRFLSAANPNLHIILAEKVFNPLLQRHHRRRALQLLRLRYLPEPVRHHPYHLRAFALLHLRLAVHR